MAKEEKLGAISLPSKQQQPLTSKVSQNILWRTEMSSRTLNQYILFHLRREKTLQCKSKPLFFACSSSNPVTVVSFMYQQQIFYSIFFHFRHCSNRNDGYPALGHDVCLSNFSSDIFTVQSGECEFSQEISRNTFYICISKKTTDKVSMGRWFFLNSLSRKRDFKIQSCHIWTNFLKQSVRFPLASSTASSEVFPQYFSVCFIAPK